VPPSDVLSVSVSNAFFSGNVLTFANTTAIAYGQKICWSLKTLLVRNGSRVHKHQSSASTILSLDQLSFPSYHHETQACARDNCNFQTCFQG